MPGQGRAVRTMGSGRTAHPAIWLGEQVVGQASLGAFDERSDLAGFEDEGGAVGVGRLAQRDPSAGELLGFQAGAAVGAAPGLGPPAGAEVCGRHAVVYVPHDRYSLTFG